jgi:hypothetical protein
MATHTSSIRRNVRKFARAARKRTVAKLKRARTVVAKEANKVKRAATRR